MHNEIYDSSGQVKKLIQFFGYCINIPKDYDELENLGEYHDHFRNADFETLKGKVNKSGFIAANIRQLSENLQTIQGETVKSLEEFLMANFLFLNGIEYEYERPYEHDTSDQHHRQYKPELLRIEKTYRNSQQLIDIAGSFVMSNPHQYKKKSSFGQKQRKPIRLLGY
jgi:DNA helicase-4